MKPNAKNHTIRLLPPIDAVVFDVYGTLVQLREKRRPYGQLLDIGRAKGRLPRNDDGALIMSSATSIEGTADLLEIALTSPELRKLESDLAAELASIELYSDSTPAIEALKQAGIQVGLCSNLAGPYGPPVQRMLPSLDAYAWSYSVGAVKPDSRIYASACASLGTDPARVLMVGDTLAADYLGPRAFGMQACHLSRGGGREAELMIESLRELQALII